MDAETEKAILADLTPPHYHTTSQLQALVATATGKPCTSRNRPSLLRKLGLTEVAHPRLAPAPKKAAAPAKAVKAKVGKEAIKRIAKATGVSAKKLTAPMPPSAITYVRRAMARKQPPSLRALCAELDEAKVAKPSGSKGQWFPSSVQALMRKIAKEAK